MLRYALASSSPVLLLVIACVFGGIWPLIAVLFVTVFVTFMDQLPRLPASETTTRGSEQRALALNVILAGLHIPLLFIGVWSVATQQEPAQAVLLAIALGLYLGQVGNSNAHELIHVSSRWPRRLGQAVFVSLLFGHHASAHPLVHHVHVATAQDPNSAGKGVGFYRFWPKAWVGSFLAGLEAENVRRARKSDRLPLMSHPYFAYCGGGLAVISVAYLIAGLMGVVVLLALCSYAQMQLLLADYVQHYGLRRAVLANGRREPAGPCHSWNAPHWYSAAMMLNAPRHSDHHQNPNRRFPALRLDPDTMPMLPAPMPVMATLALFPTLWRRVMDPRVTAVQGMRNLD